MAALLELRDVRKSFDAVRALRGVSVSEFALWNPGELGYVAGYAAAALASGQISGKEGEKFTAGKLGERTIGKGNGAHPSHTYVLTRDGTNSR